MYAKGTVYKGKQRNSTERMASTGTTAKLECITPLLVAPPPRTPWQKFTTVGERRGLHIFLPFDNLKKYGKISVHK